MFINRKFRPRFESSYRLRDGHQYQNRPLHTVRPEARTPRLGSIFFPIPHGTLHQAVDPNRFLPLAELSLFHQCSTIRNPIQNLKTVGGALVRSRSLFARTIPIWIKYSHIYFPLLQCREFHTDFHQKDDQPLQLFGREFRYTCDDTVRVEYVPRITITSAQMESTWSVEQVAGTATRFHNRASLCFHDCPF